MQNKYVSLLLFVAIQLILSITQTYGQGGDCEYQLDVGDFYFSAAGGTDFTGIEFPQGACDLDIYASENWFSASNLGDRIEVYCDANTGGARSGTLTVGLDVMDVYQAAYAPPNPPTPSTPSVANYCGSSVLTRGTPPSGITWYWQGTSSNGTSTSNSSVTYTVSSDGTYYLRARDNSCNT